MNADVFTPKIIVVIVLIVVLIVISFYIAMAIHTGSISGLENLISSGKEFKP